MRAFLCNRKLLKIKKHIENLYESIGGTYREENGHLILILELFKRIDYHIGKYGRMHIDYIKRHCRGMYTTLLSEGKLNARLHEIGLEAKVMLEALIPRFNAERDIDKALKACDMLRYLDFKLYSQT
ncbi:MAG: TnpV protein [Clostridia bacterium]|nr:TnpV protein [Clostridia bacterium]